MEINNDHYCWLDKCSLQIQNVKAGLDKYKVSFYGATLINYDTNRRDWRLHKKSKNLVNGIFVVYDHANCLSNDKNFKSLFYRLALWKCKIVIFYNCSFPRYAGDMWILKYICSNIREIIFNNCEEIHNILESILECSKIGNKCLIKNICLRSIIDCYASISSLAKYLESINHLQKIIFIDCSLTVYYWDEDSRRPKQRTMEIGESETILKYIKKSKSLLKANRLGYEQCQEVCLTLLGLKKYKLSSNVFINDINVILKIVKMIWDTKYQNEWYHVKYKL